MGGSVSLPWTPTQLITAPSPEFHNGTGFAKIKSISSDKDLIGRIIRPRTKNQNKQDGTNKEGRKTLCLVLGNRGIGIKVSQSHMSTLDPVTPLDQALCLWALIRLPGPLDRQAGAWWGPCQAPWSYVRQLRLRLPILRLLTVLHLSMHHPVGLEPAQNSTNALWGRCNGKKEIGIFNF